MTFSCKYGTPASFSDMVMTSDGKVLTGLHFVESRRRDCGERDLPIFRETRRWLDCYFSGRQPDFTPSYRICRSYVCSSKFIFRTSDS